jgi:hypothetical protein
VYPIGNIGITYGKTLALIIAIPFSLFYCKICIATMFTSAFGVIIVIPLSVFVEEMIKELKLRYVSVIWTDILFKLINN